MRIESRKGETMAKTCSRKMSVRANRSVASSILEFRLCPKRVLFGFGGEQAKRGTRESTHKKGAKGDHSKTCKKKTTATSASQKRGRTQNIDVV